MRPRETPFLALAAFEPPRTLSIDWKKPDYAFVIERAVFVTSRVFRPPPNPPARLQPASVIVARYML